MSKITKRRNPRQTSPAQTMRLKPLRRRNSLLTELELARLGDGQVAYIKTMSSAEAKRMFPTIKGLPRGIDLYALHAADGTPIALTDSRSAAVGHALEGELEIASVH